MRSFVCEVTYKLLCGYTTTNRVPQQTDFHNKPLWNSSEQLRCKIVNKYTSFELIVIHGLPKVLSVEGARTIVGKKRKTTCP